MDLFKKVKELGLQKGTYVVGAGSALEAYGIRKSNDIDIAVTNEVYEELKEDPKWREIEKPNGYKALTYDVFDICTDFNFNNYITSTETLIKSAKVVNGVAIMNIIELLNYKLALNREKDKKDVVLIQKYLHP